MIRHDFLRRLAAAPVAWRLFGTPRPSPETLSLPVIHQEFVAVGKYVDGVPSLVEYIAAEYARKAQEWMDRQFFDVRDADGIEHRLYWAESER